MNVTTKRGNADNVITYEHICDTMDDLANINPDEITLGSVAIVLSGSAGEFTVFMANSNKEWCNLISNPEQQP